MEKVICINNSFTRPQPPPIPEKGKVYNVIGETTCKCGLKCIDIGLSDNSNLKTTCTECGNTIEGTWFKASRFIPIPEAKKVTYTTILQEIEMSAN